MKMTMQPSEGTHMEKKNVSKRKKWQLMWAHIIKQEHGRKTEYETNHVILKEIGGAPINFQRQNTLIMITIVRNTSYTLYYT